MAKKSDKPKSSLVTVDGKQYWEYTNSKGKVVRIPKDKRKAVKKSSSEIVGKLTDQIRHWEDLIKKAKKRIDQIQKRDNSQVYSDLNKSLKGLSLEKANKVKAFMASLDDAEATEA